MYTLEDRRRNGRIGALVTHSRHGAEVTVAGRQAFLSRFEREVDPDGTLDPDERARRAAHARRAHMLRLAKRSAEVRRKAGAA